MTTFLIALITAIVSFWCGYGTKCWELLPDKQSTYSNLGWFMVVGLAIHLVLTVYVLFLIVVGLETTFSQQ